MPSYSNNYSKWDAIEISDDSDIEGHPNVDHKSLVAWKQRDIHEKREERKLRIAEYEATLSTNSVLIPKLKTIANDLRQASSSTLYFSQLIQRLKTQPSPEAPPDAPDVSYDSMIYSLLNKVFDEVVNEDKVDKADIAKMGDALIKRFDGHVKKLEEVNVEARNGLEEELAEQKKHITSEDVKTGWDSKYVPAPKEKPIEPAITPKAPKSTTKSTTTIETLNAPSTSTAASSKPTTKDDSDSDSDAELDDMPHMTSSLLAFSKIPIDSNNYERSFKFLQNDKGIFTPGAVDAMLLEAFNAEMAGKRRYAKQCVHQGLMIQYCEKLGRDGIGMFFKKMIAGNKQAVDVFVQDVESTYGLVKKRAAMNAAEQKKIAEQGGVEQIQLVAENPGTVISFSVPDGPPPANIKLEPSPETEGLDIEEVRKWLQMQWDIFQTFDPKMQKALKANSLEAVNKVLARMNIEDAESAVEKLQMAGILNMADGRIRDETPAGKQAAAAAAAEAQK
ncbi:hypothetical protein DL93DRAFT_2059573 [Clavulina sp. PMI_390]|nr:hypothetical protein DL93DRAFT_2059573 [Clavulina sp. PMI_390]